MSDSTKICYIDENGNIVVVESTADGNKLPCKAEVAS